MTVHLHFLYPLAPLASWNSLAPLLCLLVLSSSLPIPLNTPADHHTVKNGEGTYHVEHGQEGGKGQENKGDFPQPPQKDEEAKTKAEEINDEVGEEGHDEWMDEWIETEGDKILIPEPIQSKAEEKKGGKEKGENKREDSLEVLWRKEAGEDYGDESEKGTGQFVDQETGRDSHFPKKAEEAANEEGEENIMDSNEDYMDFNEDHMDSNEDYTEPLTEPSLTPQTKGKKEQEYEGKKDKEKVMKNVVH